MKIYLACPYSHPNPEERELRFLLSCKKAAQLMEQGHIVFSPLSHSHPISKYTVVEPCDHDFWLRQDLPMIDWCDELWIYQLDGWEKSKGIQVEIKKAESLRKPIQYV